jgi:hypothetical protein
MLNLQLFLFSSKARITREGAVYDLQHLTSIVYWIDPEINSEPVLNSFQE